MPCDKLLQERDLFDVESAAAQSRSFFFLYLLGKKIKNLLTSQSQSSHKTFLTTENYFTHKANPLRHQIEAGNMLSRMEDEPCEECEHSFKNTQRILVISSALKASITAVIKKLLRSQKIPLRKKLKRNPATE